MHHFDQHTRGLVGALSDRSGPLIARINAKSGDADKQRSRSDQEKYNDCRGLLFWLEAAQPGL
jgi:hypothetical protein